MNGETGFEYDAFISYRRVEPDAALAVRLHARLESFRPPASSKTAPQKLRVCMDREEFVPTDSLSDEIRRRLDGSQFLIVLCSPASVESPWVQREVERFVETGRQHQILLALVSGEPREVFPPALRNEAEALAADIRGRNRREQLRKIETEKLRLLAPILHCDFADLQQREAKRRAQRLQRWAAAGLTLAAAFSGIAAFALWQWSVAEDERQVADRRMNQAIGVLEDVLWDLDEELLAVAGTGRARADVAQVVAGALQALEVDADQGEALELEWKRVVAHLRLARLVETSTGTEQALRAYTRVLQRAESLLADHPESPNALQAVVDAVAGLGRLALEEGDLPSAEAHLRRQESLATRLVRDVSGTPEDVYRLVASQRGLAEVWAASDGKRAVQVLEEAEQTLGAYLIRWPDSHDLLHQLALVHEDFAYLAFERRDSSEMLQRHRAAREILEGLLKREPTPATRIALAKVYEQFGFMARFSGQLELEKEYFWKAWSLIWPAFLVEPQHGGYRERLFVAAGELADATYRGGSLASALQMYELRTLVGQAIHEREPDLVAPQRRLVYARRDWAARLAEAGRWKKSDGQYRRLLDDLEKLNGFEGSEDATVSDVRETIFEWSRRRASELMPRVRRLRSSKVEGGRATAPWAEPPE